MRAALATKLKCVGPVQAVETELRRFQLWLPPRLRPLLVRLRSWQQAYRRTAGVEARLALERQALAVLRRELRLLPERALIEAFLERVGAAHQRSLEARRLALQGEAVASDLDDQLVGELLAWLAADTGHGHRELADWLARMLRAWWEERTQTGLARRAQKPG